jgi:transcriptional regulator with XRE-family HTH domain
MGEKIEDGSMLKVRELFEKSGLSLHALGMAMGYDPGTARQSAFQFMKSGDPRVSMLRRFAKAMGMDVRELLGDGKGKRG